ncbi:MAG: winged helix-turn-helix transcriptional regulator [Limisphaerales bacterium]
MTTTAQSGGVHLPCGMVSLKMFQIPHSKALIIAYLDLRKGLKRFLFNVADISKQTNISKTVVRQYLKELETEGVLKRNGKSFYQLNREEMENRYYYDVSESDADVSESDTHLSENDTNVSESDTDVSESDSVHSSNLHSSNLDSIKVDSKKLYSSNIQSSLTSSGSPEGKRDSNTLLAKRLQVEVASLNKQSEENGWPSDFTAKQIKELEKNYYELSKAC